jgi:uncharacterized protein YPO0396
MTGTPPREGAILSLTRVFLHNWHRFNHRVIDVVDGLYLAGHNGSGKSSLLDAIQLVLVANLTRIRFNSSAQDASARDLDTYVRGKIGEDRWLRPGRSVAYVALEFAVRDARGEAPGAAPRASSRASSRATPQAVTVGMCVEAEAGRSAERTAYILTGPLDPELFVPRGKPLTRRELRRALASRPGAKSYDHVEEYQTDLLDRLGGLNERFFDLFLRALYFKPIPNIDAFVEQWLLEKKDLRLDTLRAVRERLRDLRADAERVESRIARLDEIARQQREVRRLGQLRDQYAVLAGLAREALAAREAEACERRIAATREEGAAVEQQLALAQATLQGAESALDAVKRRLYDSDARRRRDELSRLIQQLDGELAAIRQRWDALRLSARDEVAELRAILEKYAPDDRGPGAGALEDGERAAVRALIDATGAWPDDPPAPPALSPLAQAASGALSAARERAREALGVARDGLRALDGRARELQADIDALEREGVVRYRPEVERMRDRLLQALGERPRLLCELLEVADPRWQDAVEAMLGPRRQHIVVQPGQFDAAARELDLARSQDRLYDVGLIDLERVVREGRRAQPGSLAQFVTAPTPALRAYVDQVLGGVTACETVEQARQHRRAVTPEVMVYGEFTLRAVNPREYQPHYIGQRARQSQLESLRRDLAHTGARRTELERRARDLETLTRLLNREVGLSRLADRLGEPLDDRPVREQHAEAQAQWRALDLSQTEALEREARQLEARVRRERDAERALAEQRGALGNQRLNQQEQKLAAERALAGRCQESAALRAQLAHAVADAERMLAERLSQPDLAGELANAESGQKRFHTLANDAAVALSGVASSYNTAEQFAADAQDPNEPRYAEERDRLAATDLPAYKDRIAQAEREAEDELREHVLHTLREQIGAARRKLDQINDALSQLPPFGQEKYRFTCARADDAREFYDLITADAQLLGAGSLFESQFYAEHKAAFDRFYDALTRRPQTRADEEEQNRLTDYRHYLTYDIEVTHLLNGQKSRLSRIMNQTSGGETQTPFYLTIAASFVQLYGIQERSKRPAIRLVAFDEAFSKMDQERIGATLDLFQRFGLQIVTATPLERCEYLAPKICTSLVLSAVRDGVHIEPYWNYAARLQASQLAPGAQATEAQALDV